MELTIFENPKLRGEYQHVGEYKRFPVYAGPMPPPNWVAMAGDDGRSVYINREVYRKLAEAPQFRRFLKDICEHELRLGPVHVHGPGPRTEEEKEVLDFLKSKGLLD